MLAIRFSHLKYLVRTEIGLVTSLTRIVVMIAVAMAAASPLPLRIQVAQADEGLRKASDMLPAETQAFVCLPDSEAFLANWGKTELGKLAADDQLKDFWVSQQESIRKRLSDSGWQLNVKFDDLRDICSGQAAIGWIARPNATEKPYSMGIVIDILGKEAQVDALMLRIEKEMQGIQAQTATVSLGDLTVKHYRMPPVANDKRVRDSYYVVSAGQLFAADDMETIKELVAAQKTAPAESISKSPLYLRVQDRIQRDAHPAELEYFVRPFGFARLLRAVSAKSTRGQIDVLKLLEEQGFESILCAAGSVQFSKEDLDMHHQGFILRDAWTTESAEILDFPNNKSLVPPPWIDPNSASVLGFSWDFSEAFPKFKGLVDGYIGEEQFEEILKGIKMDPNGPQIDIKKEILPYIGTEFYAVTEIVPPITPESKRSLICVKLDDPDNMLRGVLDRYSKTEPGSSIEDIGDYRVWKFSNEEIQEETLDFDSGSSSKSDDPGAKGGAKADDDEPLLKQWAVTLIDGWFVFASNPDSLAKVIERASQGDSQHPFEALPEVRACRAMQHKLLGSAEMSFSEVDLSERSFEMQYELFRQNILPQSRSLLALIAERLLKTDKAKPQQLQGSKLPPFQAVKQFFTPAGLVVRTEEDGWAIDGFILGKKKLSETTEATP